MFVLIAGNGQLETEQATLFAQSEAHAVVYSKQLAMKFPDYEIYKYKLVGKYIPDIKVNVNEMIINDKGEIYPK